MRDVGRYRISAVSIGDNDSWVQVMHDSCGVLIFGSEETDSDETDLSTVLSLVEAHHCPEENK